MSWRDRAALILENEGGAELTKPPKPPLTEVLSVLSVPTPALSGENAPAAIELFAFAAPDDCDAEWIEERACIIWEGNGCRDYAKARQEAVWLERRERAGRTLKANAARVLAAPEWQRETLFARFQNEAARRYDDATGRRMATELRSVFARGVDSRPATCSPPLATK